MDSNQNSPAHTAPQAGSVTVNAGEDTRPMRSTPERGATDNFTLTTCSSSPVPAQANVTVKIGEDRLPPRKEKGAPGGPGRAPSRKRSRKIQADWTIRPRAVRRRRIAPPIAPKPISIIAQLAGSGTACDDPKVRLSA